MKKTLLGLVAATLVATPALAESWRDRLYAHLDADVDGQITFVELKNAGCKTHPDLFKYADQNHDGSLTRKEFFVNRQILGYCKK